MKLAAAIKEFESGVVLDPELKASAGNMFETKGGPAARALFASEGEAVAYWLGLMYDLVPRRAAFRWVISPVVEKMQTTSADARQTQRMAMDRFCVSAKFIVEDNAPDVND